MEMAPGTEGEQLFLDICDTAYPGEVHFFTTVSHFAAAKAYLEGQFTQLIHDSALPADVQNKPFAFWMPTNASKQAVSIPTTIDLTGKVLFPALPHCAIKRDFEAHRPSAHWPGAPRPTDAADP
jgi:hypothetical protein